MSRLFISHSSRNDDWALALRDWLLREGWSGTDDIFLDLDPNRGIAAGQRWVHALEQAATRCEAVLFVVSHEWLASKWCVDEYQLGNKLNKKLFALLVDDSMLERLPGGLAAQWQVVRLTGEPAERFLTVHPITGRQSPVHIAEAGLASLKRGLEKAGIGPETFDLQEEPDGPFGWRAPYRGLEALEAEDAAVFFGRNADMVRGIDALRGLAARKPPRLLVILGASGAGKSSFLRAGLWPRLNRDDSQWMPLRVIRAGRGGAIEGSEGLLAALEEVCRRFDMQINRAELRRRLATPERFIELLRGLRQAAAKRAFLSEPPLPVLCLDQAEEVFAADAGPESDSMLRLARSAIEDGGALLLVTIRSDAYGLMQSAKALAGIDQVPLSLGPVPDGEIAHLIRAPAEILRRKAGPSAPVFDAAVIERLQAEIAGETDALPLLAFVLQRLMREYAGARTIGISELEETGGVAAAIESAAEAALADAGYRDDRAQQREVLRRLFIPRLARIDRDSKAPQRRVARQSDLPADLLPLARALTERRLLVAKLAARAEGAEPSIATLEVAHEALLRRWPTLADLLARDRDALLLLDGILNSASDWQKAEPERKSDYLAHHGSRLLDALALKLRGADWERELAPALAYLAACQAREDAERAEKEAALAREQQRLKEIAAAQAQITEEQAHTARLQRRARWTLAAIAAAVIVGVAIGIWQYQINLFRQAQLDRVQADLSSAQTEIKHRQAELDAAQADLLTAQAEIKRRQAQLDQAQAALTTEQAENKRRQAELDRAQASLAIAQEENERRQEKLERAQVNLLAELASAERLRGNIDSALRFGVYAARLASRLRHDEFTNFPVRSALAGAVSESGWRRVLIGHQRHVYSAAFSPDGARIVTSSADWTARIWDIASGQQLSVLQGHGSIVRFAAFSPDGSRVVTGGDDKAARVWDVATGREVSVLVGHENTVMHVAYSRDGSRIVTASWDKTARVWDAGSGKQLMVLRGHNEHLKSAAFSPDGSRIVTASGDKTARIWNAKTGKEIKALSGHLSGVNDAVFSPDGRHVVTASDDSSAKIWDAKTGEEINDLSGHEAAVRSAAFSPDGSRVVTASADNTLRLWDAREESDQDEPLVVWRGHEDSVNSAAFSPDGLSIASASDDLIVRIWDAASNTSMRTLTGHDEGLNSAAFADDGNRVVTASVDKTARIWDVATGKVLAVLRGHTDAVSSAAFSPDGKRIVTAADDGTARIWNAATAKEAAILRGHEGPVNSARFSPDGSRVITAGGDKTARIWDAENGNVVAVLRGHTNAVNSAVFSPDGLFIATASADYTARVWDAESGKEIRSIDHGDAVRFAVFGPQWSKNGFIATASNDKTVRIWYFVYWGPGSVIFPVGVLRGHKDMVSSVAFAPDESHVVTSSEDMTARIWDTFNQTEVTVFKGHENIVFSAAFSHDGKRVVTASDDNTARIWDVRFTEMSVEDLLVEVCARRLRGLSWLTQEERTLAGQADATVNVCQDVGTGSR